MSWWAVDGTAQHPETCNRIGLWTLESGQKPFGPSGWFSIVSLKLPNNPVRSLLTFLSVPERQSHIESPTWLPFPRVPLSPQESSGTFVTQSYRHKALLFSEASPRDAVKSHRTHSGHAQRPVSLPLSVPCWVMGPLLRSALESRDG